MFKTCFSKCVARNPIYYEIPATYHINNHVNTINYNGISHTIHPPPIPPRRCRKIKNSLGELIPLSTENICVLNNINCGIGNNEIYSSIPDDLKSINSAKSLTLPIKKKSLTPNERPKSLLSTSISLPDLKIFDDDWFNTQLANDYFAQNLQNDKDKAEIEPLFTVDINIKNERNGVVSNRKIFM